MFTMSMGNKQDMLEVTQSVAVISLRAGVLRSLSPDGDRG
jgi:hypothetical protein